MLEMSRRRRTSPACLLAASLALVLAGASCDGILGLPDNYVLCGPAGAGGCGGSGGAGGAGGTDGGADGP